MEMPYNPPAPQGWQCPICKRVYSPTTPFCYYCGNDGTVSGVQTVPKGIEFDWTKVAENKQVVPYEYLAGTRVDFTMEDLTDQGRQILFWIKGKGGVV